MATVKQAIAPLEALFPASNFAQAKVVAGTNFPVPSLAFDTTTEESAYFVFQALNYGSGNVTVRIQWYADTASSGGVVWGCSLAAITPNTDTQNIETKAFATENTQADTHLGATSPPFSQRLHEVAVTVSNLDSVAAGDWCALKLARKVSDGSDDMAGDALVVGIQVEYSDA